MLQTMSIINRTAFVLLISGVFYNFVVKYTLLNKDSVKLCRKKENTPYCIYKWHKDIISNIESDECKFFLKIV